MPDPRRRRGVRCRLVSLLAVAVCAVLAGATTFAAIADWAADLDETARRRLGFTGRIPAGSTVWRFLIRIDAHVLQAVWHIEDRLHWVRDVTLGQDAHQARTGHGPAVAAVLRNTAIGYHRGNDEPTIARATRRADRRPHDLINAVTSTTRTQ